MFLLVKLVLEHIKLGKIDFYFDKNMSNFVNFEHVFDSNVLDVIV